MELSQFVRSTLVELIEGIQKAQVEVKDTGGKINPYQFSSNPHLGYYCVAGEGINVPINQVHFEVVLAQVHGDNKKEGIGVFLMSIGVGAQTEQAQSSNTLSRITFEVPVAFPQHPETISG
jgi:hypothetical protein